LNAMKKNQAMDVWDFKKWRKSLRYTQLEAAHRLGVSRGTIQHWESERYPIPRVVELACRELVRCWKRRPEFGPATLVYADSPLIQEVDGHDRIAVRCERYPSNNDAIEQARRLRDSPGFNNPFILDGDGEVVWTTFELLNECDRRTGIRRPADGAEGQ
jgi:DNA-binding XRE family transcriptional regulator